MKMKMRVEYHDGSEVRLTVSPLAIIGWEKRTGKKMTDLGGGGVSMGDMVTMAYEQVRLSGGTDDDYEVWAASLADIDAEDMPDPPQGDVEA